MKCFYRNIISNNSNITECFIISITVLTQQYYQTNHPSLYYEYMIKEIINIYILNLNERKEGENHKQKSIITLYRIVHNLLLEYCLGYCSKSNLMFLRL